MKNENPVVEKSRRFAVRIVRLYQFLSDEKREFVMSKQILRSGTSIGANIHEAQRAQSKKDFLAKMCIASKEASETEYWLNLLYETGYMDKKLYQSVANDCVEIIKLLITIVKSSGQDN